MIKSENRSDYLSIWLNKITTKLPHFNKSFYITNWFLFFTEVKCDSLITCKTPDICLLPTSLNTYDIGHIILFQENKIKNYNIKRIRYHCLIVLNFLLYLIIISSFK